MRSADQIGRTVEQWAEFKQAERRRTLRELLASLRHARENHVEWYTWVVAGCPRVGQAEYDAIKAAERKRRKSA